MTRSREPACGTSETLDTVSGVHVFSPDGVAAVASLWNAYRFSVLKGRIDEVSQNFIAHLRAPGLHR